MNVRPLQDRLIVKRNDAERQSPGGIYIPDNAQEAPVEGTALAVGPTVKDVRVGDRVLFSKYAGSEIKIEDKPVLMMREEDVLGVVLE